MTYFSRTHRMPFPSHPDRAPRMPRPPYGYPMPNTFPQQRDAYPPFYPQNPTNFGQWQQPFNPYQQMPSQGSRMPHHLNTIMGHVGTVTNGINMMRQVGSLMSLFRF